MKGTRAEYARHAGVSAPAVTKMVKTGRISLTDDGKIDFTKADQQRLNNNNPSYFRGINNNQHGLLQTAPALSQSQPLPVLDHTSHPASFAEERARRERFQANLAELQYKQKKGELISRYDVEEGLKASGQTIRQGLDGIITWADEITSVASKEGVDGVRAFLKNKVRTLELEIEENLKALGKNDVAG